MSERPQGVTILGILGIIGGLILILAGFGFLGKTIGTAIIISIGIVDLTLGAGSFLAWSWVWPLGIVFSLIGVMTGIGSVFMTGNFLLWTVEWLGIITGVAILYHLLQRPVIVYFCPS